MLTRIDPTDKQDAFVAGDRLTFKFPHGCYDLSTLKLFFRATIGGGATANNQSLPRDVETLIEHLKVYVGEVVVNEIGYYNQMFRALMDYNSSLDEISERALLGNSMYINHNLNNPVYNVSNTQFCMSKWYGFLGSGLVVDTGMMGGITVELTLAPNAACLGNSAATTYTLNGVHMMVEQAAEPSLVLEYDDYKTLFQFNNSLTQQTSMMVDPSTEYVLALYQPADYRSRATSAAAIRMGTSYYFSHGTGNSIAFPPGVVWNFRLDGAPWATSWLSAEVAPEFMRLLFPKTGVIYSQSLARSGQVLGTISMSEWLQGFWTTGLRLRLGAPTMVTFESQCLNNSTPIYTMLIAKSRKRLNKL